MNLKNKHKKISNTDRLIYGKSVLLSPQQKIKPRSFSTLYFLFHLPFKKPIKIFIAQYIFYKIKLQFENFKTVKTWSIKNI